jgi:hypothetical protein
MELTPYQKYLLQIACVYPRNFQRPTYLLIEKEIYQFNQMVDMGLIIKVQSQTPTYCYMDITAEGRKLYEKIRRESKVC